MLKVLSEDQSALARISATENPLLERLDVAAPLVECPRYLVVSIPALSKEQSSHRLRVQVLTGL